MAIAARAAGTWSERATSATVAIPNNFSLTTGDRMYLLASWKDAAITASVAGWTELTEFADGAVVAGNGTGSMKVGCWYKDVTGATESEPTLQFSSTVNLIASAVVLVFSKAAGETWDTPVARTAAITNWTTTTQTATASASYSGQPNSLVIGLAGIRDDSAAFTRAPTTGISALSGVTWNGNYVEYPATHFSTATGNDMAADAGYRLVTAYTGSASFTQAAVLSAAETGAALWVAQSVTVSNDKTGAATAVTHASAATATGQSDRSNTAAASHVSAAVVTGSKSIEGAISVSHASATSAEGSKTVAFSGSATAVSHTSVAGVAGHRSASSDASVTHTHSVTVSGFKSVSGSATVAHTQSIGTGNTTDRSGAISVSQTASAIVVGAKDAIGAVGVSHASASSAEGYMRETREGTAYAEHSHLIVVSGFKSASGTASAEHAHTVSLTGAKAASGTISVSHASSTAPEGIAARSSSATVSHASSVGLTATSTRSGTASVSAVHAVNLVGGTQRSGAVSIGHAHETQADGTAAELTQGFASIIHTHLVTVSGFKGALGTISVNHSHSAVGNGFKAALGTASVVHSAPTVVTGRKAVGGVVSLDYVQTVTAHGSGNFNPGVQPESATVRIMPAPAAWIASDEHGHTARIVREASGQIVQRRYPSATVIIR